MDANRPVNSTRPAIKRWLRRFWGLLPLSILFLLVGVIIHLFGMIQIQANVNKEQKIKALRQEASQSMVVAMELEPGSVQDRLNLPGVVRPWVEIIAVAEVGGIISKKNVTKGDSVRKGDILVVIDDRDYVNSLNSAQAAFNASKTALDRFNQLLTNKVAAQAQVDEARVQYETSKAAMANAQLRLDRTVIRSPLTGVVDQTFVESGQFVNPGQQVARVLQIDRVKVEVGIPESDVDAVRKVKHFSVTIDALGGRVFNGEFCFLARSAQSLARLYNLEIAMNNPHGEILPDMFTRVDIVKKEVPRGLAIPLFSLLPGHAGGKAVFVAENGHARLQEVKTGIQEGWRVEITEGLKAGDRVVVVGHRDLNDGAAVKVVRTVTSIEELNQ